MLYLPAKNNKWYTQLFLIFFFWINARRTFCSQVFMLRKTSSGPIFHNIFCKHIQRGHFGICHFGVLYAWSRMRCMFKHKHLSFHFKIIKTTPTFSTYDLNLRPNETAVILLLFPYIDNKFPKNSHNENNNSSRILI